MQFSRTPVIVLRIGPTPKERAELLRLGNEINLYVADVMIVVKPQIYHRWLNPKAPEQDACYLVAEKLMSRSWDSSSWLSPIC